MSCVRVRQLLLRFVGCIPVMLGVCLADDETCPPQCPPSPQWCPPSGTTGQRQPSPYEDAAPPTDATTPSDPALSQAEPPFRRFTTASSPQSFVPNTIGDFFGTSGSVSTIARTFTVTNLDIDVTGGSLGSNSMEFGVGRYNFSTVTDPALPLGTNVADTDGLMSVGTDESGDSIEDTFPLYGYSENEHVPGGGRLLRGTVFYSDGSGNAQDGVPTDSSWDAQYTVAYDLQLPSPGSWAGGRQKTAENNSPLPRHRVYFNYNYFDNVPLLSGGVNVQRFTPGLEIPFFDNRFSIEARFPFAMTADNNILLGGETDSSNLQFGNISTLFKYLFYQSDTTAVSAVLGVSAPTADDLHVRLTDGTDLVRVDNEAVRLWPCICGLYAPNDRFFMQGYLQVDFDTNGNPVYVNPYDGLERAGTITAPAFMSVDLNVGYWTHRNPTGVVTGFAPMFEVHYNRSLQDSDVIHSGDFRIGSPADDIQIVNATFGGVIEFQNNSTLTMAYVTPIGNSSDQQFDGEFRLMLNYFFDGLGSSLAGETLDELF